VAGIAAEARFELKAIATKNEGRERSRPFSILRVVIVREGGRSSIPRLVDSIAGAGDYWMPAFAGMTGRVQSRPFHLLQI
jgi:hypothetical protein